MTRFERGLAALVGAPRGSPQVSNAVTVESLGLSGGNIRTDLDAAMKLSTVSRCIDILSDSIGKMPFFVYDGISRVRVDHPIMELLGVRPNQWQTPFAFRKQLEGERVANGNGLAWIRRDPRTMEPTELVPVPKAYWSVSVLSDGSLQYRIQHPFTNESIVCGRMDVVHRTSPAPSRWSTRMARSARSARRNGSGKSGSASTPDLQTRSGSRCSTSALTTSP